jgi:hypothetical protein
VVREWRGRLGDLRNMKGDDTKRCEITTKIF